MLIAGTGELAEDFANLVERHPTLGIRVIGHLTVPIQLRRVGDLGGTSLEASRGVSRPIIGSVEEMHDILARIDSLL